MINKVIFHIISCYPAQWFKQTAGAIVVCRYGDSQFSKTEISGIKINSWNYSCYQLRYNGNNVLMFATYQDNK
ncbi:DUF2138 family protein [Shigella sonnei]